MRVINDREERTETTEIGFLSLLTHVLMVSFGVLTFVFAPVPMILSSVRLYEPWSKIAIVTGSLLALVFLEVPVPAVLLTFVFGMYVAHTVSSKTLSLWNFLGVASLVAFGTVLAMLFTEASLAKVSLANYWNTAVEGLVREFSTVVQVGTTVEWDLIRGLLFYEGPFLIISLAIFSAWLSVGVCAHAGWLPEKNAFASNALRNFSPSAVPSVVFILALLASRFVAEDWKHFFGGVARVAAALLFVEGTLVLSRWMALRGIRTPFRTASYCAFVLVGFYALIGMGLFSPLFSRKKRSLLPKVPVTQMEEVV